MLALVLRGPNDFALEEVPTPEPGPGQVLVRIRACGICQTDYKAIRGIRTNVTFPTIPGHEPSGVVVAVGPGVREWREGDEVIIQPSGFCGRCENCRLGRTHYCAKAYVMGGDGPDDVRPGAFAEYMIAGEETLYRKPPSLSFEAACQTEPVSGAWKGVIRNSEMQVGDDVVIIGTGGIGLYCLMVAKAAGAGRLVAVDVSDYALATARRLGATHCVNPSRCDARAAIYKILPDGPDLVVEAAGPIEAVRLMVSLLRRGTRWNVFGITTHETFELDGGLMHFLEARMDSSFGTNPEAMVHAIRLMERGLVDPEKAITHRFPLTEFDKAMEVMESAERNKVVILP